MLRRRFHHAVCLASLLAVGLFAAAEQSGAAVVLGIPGVLAAWWLFRPMGERTLSVPRWAINVLLAAATLAMLASAVGAAAEQLVGVLGGYLVWLLLIKLAELRGARDRGQALLLCVSLAVAAVLTSVTLQTGALLVLFAPALLWATALHQLLLGAERAGRGTAAERPAGSPGLFRNLGVTAAVSVVLMGVIAAGGFIAMPRGLGGGLIGRWQPPRVSAETGFRDNIQLGVAGNISESPSIALEMEVFAAGRPLELPEKTHYLRGAVLDVYDRKRGQWTRAEDHESGDPRYTAIIEPAAELMASRRGLVQRITLRDKRTDHLFALNRPERLWASVPLDQPSRYILSPDDGTLKLVRRFGPLEYVVVSEVGREDLEDGGAPPLPPAAAAAGERRAWMRSAREGRDPFSSGPIRELAARILRDSDIERDRAAQIVPELDERAASAFQRYLVSTCQYTLNLPDKADFPAPEGMDPAWSADPIAAFLFRTRRGHCEYFASAMAALGQAAGLNVRMITGYVASDYDARERKYIVRQSSAHAWVEVEVRPGRWKVFDPSPEGAVREARQPPTGLAAAIRDWLDSMELAWITNVVAYDQSRQVRMLGIDDRRESAWLRDLRGLAARLGLGRSGTAIDAILRFGATVLLVFVAVAGAVFGGRVLLAPLWTWRRRRRRAAAAAGPALEPALAEQVGFYAEMLERLERAGAGKPEGLPPLTHARRLAGRDAELARAAGRLSDLFYRLRFGRTALGTAEMDEARSLLGAVSARLAATGGRRGGAGG
ncbi:MAG: DUF3488 domain-containing protein [Phycisphaerales bacterium]|nr:DUF3488 domain-containing protein [Phycisphaerales bacterium]